MPYLSTYEVVFHKEALYQVYVPLLFVVVWAKYSVKVFHTITFWSWRQLQHLA